MDNPCTGKVHGPSLQSLSTEKERVSPMIYLQQFSSAEQHK